LNVSLFIIPQEEEIAKRKTPENWWNS